MKKTEEMLLKLKTLLEKEKKLLLSGIKSGEEADRLQGIEEEKLHLLSKIAKLSKEDLIPFINLLREIETVNAEVKDLLINNLNFLENLMKELFPEGEATYGNKLTGKSTFEKKI